MTVKNTILFLVFAFISVTGPAFAIPKIIFDSDIARVDSLGNDISDIDDLGALAVINALMNQGKCELLCVVTNSRSNRVVEMIDAVNTYYHNTGIPIGIRGGNSAIIEDRNSYAKFISGRFQHLQKSVSAASATDVLRQALSTVSRDDTVIYIHADAIANWDFLSIAPLLESGSDDISKLSGWELFNEKVDKLVSYIPCLPNNKVSDNCPDWSNQPSTNASNIRFFLANYQNQLIGNTTAVVEAHLPTKLWQQSDTHPIRMAYEYYYSETPPPWHNGHEIPESISIYGDGLGVFFTIMEDSNSQLFSTVVDGSFILDQNSKLRWRDKPNLAKHNYFYTVPEQQSHLWAILDELICYRPIPKD